MKLHQGSYTVLEFHVGKEEKDLSSLTLLIHLPQQEWDPLLEQLRHPQLELTVVEEAIQLQRCTKDQTAPRDFYSTTNHPTEVYWEGQWIPVSYQRMDASIVIRDGKAICTKLRDLRAGDLVVCGEHGIRIHPPQQEDRHDHFAFMTTEVSSERYVERQVRHLAETMLEIQQRQGRIIFVAGPVVVHTGGVQPMVELIEKGYVQGFLSGNALAVHDIEHALYGTSLGVHLESGELAPSGHKHHMMAINEINHAGSIVEAVQKGVLQSGIMHALVQYQIPFSLAGSIRDDGPLPDTEMDLIQAQAQYATIIEGCEIVIMLSSMLHAIGTGNMLPSTVKTICVDINPAVVAKLADRGSAQAEGLVTDVGLFLTLLNQYCRPIIST